MAKVPTIPRMMGVLVTIRATVIVFDVADLSGANNQGHGGRPNHNPCNCFVVADLNNANCHKDGGCPGHHPCSCHCCLILQISKAPMTRMVGVLITTHTTAIVV